MWFTRARRTHSPALRLFCFPNAGAGPSAFRGWPELLSPAIEMVGVQLPGREGRFREAPYQNRPALLQDLTEALRPELSVPFAFFGHSLGAFLAFEAAHLVRERTGKQPVHLFVSACRPPDSVSELPLIHHLPDDEFIAALTRIFGDGIPAAVLQDREFLAALLPALRADVQLFEGYCYAPRPALDCPVSAFGGRHDQAVNPDQLTGWKSHTTQQFECRLFDAGHLYLQSERAALAAAVRRKLLALVAA